MPQQTMTVDVIPRIQKALKHGRLLDSVLGVRLGLKVGQINRICQTRPDLIERVMITGKRNHYWQLKEA